MTVTYVVKDFEVQKMFRRLDSALSPIGLAQFLGGVVDPYLRERAEDRFTAEGDDVVGKWAPLTEATQNIREQLGYGPSHPINVRTGELERYITQTEGNANATMWGASLTLPGGAGVGGDLEDKYVAAQEGGVGPSGKSFPSRPVLGMNERDYAQILLLLAGYVETAARV